MKNKQQQSKHLSMFPFELFVVKTNHAKSLESWTNVWGNFYLPLTHGLHEETHSRWMSGGGGAGKQRSISALIENRPVRCQGKGQIGAHLPNLTQVKKGKVALQDMIVLNCRSARKKTDQIHQYITEHYTDLTVLTETWFSTRSRDHKWISSSTPAGYKFNNRPRASGQWSGGITVIHKAPLNCTAVLPDHCHKAHSFENLQCQLFSDSLTVKVTIMNDNKST